jgi:hypothetical protein
MQKPTRPLQIITSSLLIFFVCLFSDCSNKPAAKPETFGELDTARIATDTAMEANIDLSYEYQNTLAQNDSVVYDFLAYDRPTITHKKKWEGKFIVIKRTNTQQDTIIKGSRLGPVRGLSLADLDGDGRPEILFYEDQAADTYRWIVHIYSPHTDGKYQEIRWREDEAKSSPGHYRGRDTFFVYQDHLIRRYPYYGQGDTASAHQWQSYKLKSGKMVLENEKLVQ